jgi:hypothetical protein
MLEQYVDQLSSEPARRQACRSGVSAVAVEVFVNIAGLVEIDRNVTCTFFILHFNEPHNSHLHL